MKRNNWTIIPVEQIDDLFAELDKIMPLASMYDVAKRMAVKDAHKYIHDKIVYLNGQAVDQMAKDYTILDDDMAGDIKIKTDLPNRTVTLPKVHNDITCPCCDGTGDIISNSLDCDRKTCPDCKGEGIVDVMAEQVQYAEDR